jgi:DUF4097 and DUF4098 domain-containing protein YvlB
MLTAILALALVSTTPAGGITKVVIIARAGSLAVNGRSSAAEIRATGNGESPDAKLVARRDGAQLTIEAVTPDDTSLDFDVMLPTGVAVSINDGSGSMTVKNVGELDVTDGSGSMDIDGVTGNVRISDGSGSIDVKHVSGSVTITNDGSGAVNASDVRGDFTVLKKGSGHVEYERIGGRMWVPKK